MWCYHDLFLFIKMTRKFAVDLCKNKQPNFYEFTINSEAVAHGESQSLYCWDCVVLWAFGGIF